MAPVSALLTPLFGALSTFAASGAGQAILAMSAMALTMGGGQGGGGGGVAPALPPIPKREDPAVRDARNQFLFKESQRGGRRGTVLTGAQGLQSEPVLGAGALVGVGG